MTTTLTRSATFTVVDIRKVVDRFAADFSMMVQATGLRDRDCVSWTVADLKVFAEYRYIQKVNVILKDATGVQIRAAVYTVAESAIGGRCDRPGNNLWPHTPGGELIVVVSWTEEWTRKTPEQQAAFCTEKMNFQWVTSCEDTSFATLTATHGQRYESNGYGWERTNYSQ